MTWTRPDRPQHEAGGFTEARAAADRAEAVQQNRAARTVAGNSRDSIECRELLSMLGLFDLTPVHRR